MISSLRTQLSIFIAAVLSLPCAAQGQSSPQSFDEFSQILKVGQTIVVTDTGGVQTKGKIADLSASSLTVFTGSGDAPPTRTFAEGTVAHVKVPDSLGSGAAIGAAVGAGFALWDFLIDPSEPGNAAFLGAAVGLGALIGLGIDAMHDGGKVLYLAHQPAVLALSENDRKRASVVIGGNFGRYGQDGGLPGPTVIARGVAGGAFLNPHMSVSAEAVWLTPSTKADAQTIEMEPLNRRGSEYLLGTVPAQFSLQRRTPYSVSGFVGYHPPGWHRIHWAFLGGLTVRRNFESSTEEHPVATGPTSYVMEVRQFSRNQMQTAAAFGIDGRIPVSRHLAVAPQARLDFGFSWGAVRAGVAMLWTL